MFLKGYWFNPVVADVEATSAESVNRNLQRPAKNQSPLRLLLQNQRVKRLYKDTGNSIFLFSLWITDFQQLKLLRGDCVLMIGMIHTIAWLALLVLVKLRTKPIMLYLPFCQLSVIRHILTNQLLRCWADGGFEISKKRLQAVFSRLAFFPTRPHHPLSPSSLHVCVRDD